MEEVTEFNLDMWARPTLMSLNQFRRMIASEMQRKNLYDVIGAIPDLPLDTKPHFECDFIEEDK